MILHILKGVLKSNAIVFSLIFSLERLWQSCYDEADLAVPKASLSAAQRKLSSGLN